MKRSLFRIVCRRCLVVLGALSVGLFGGSCSDGGGSSPNPQGAAAAETAATMSRTSMVGVGSLTAFQVPETPVATATLGESMPENTLTAQGLLGRSGVLGLLRRHADGGSTQAAVTDVPCSVSGSLELTCDAITGGSEATVVSLGCTEDLLGIDLIIGGSFHVISDDPDCEDGLDAATEVDVTFSNYALVTEIDGEELGRVTLSGVFSSSGATEPECADGAGMVAGSFVIQSQSQGIVSRVEARDLTLAVQNTAATCETSVTINGTLIVVDGEAGQRLTQTYTDFVVTSIPDGGAGTFVTISGVASTPCLGDVQFTTLTPLHVPDEGECPIAGVVDVTVLDVPETSRITYNPDGSVDIDFEADGSVEITRPSCDDLSSPCS